MNTRTTIFVAATLATLAAPLAAQVSAGNGAPLSSILDGASEVPGPGDEDGIGTGTARVNPGRQQFCYTLNVNNIEPATIAHVHAGAAGEAGPVVIGLTPPTNGSSQGCVSISRELARDIVRNPENFYFNVHNAEFPAGAVRGQLAR